MNTIEKRKELITEAMSKFEQNRMLDWPFLAGFYASLLTSIAADKPSDTEYIVHCMLAGMDRK